MKEKIHSCKVRILLSIAMGLLFSLSVFAQEITLKGNVKDLTGEPIIGGSVLVKGTTNGTITDFDGNYTLNVPSSAIIVFSYVGYIPGSSSNLVQNNGS